MALADTINQLTTADNQLQGVIAPLKQAQQSIGAAIPLLQQAATALGGGTPTTGPVAAINSIVKTLQGV